MEASARPQAEVLVNPEIKSRDLTHRVKALFNLDAIAQH